MFRPLRGRPFDTTDMTSGNPFLNFRLHQNWRKSKYNHSFLGIKLILRSSIWQTGNPYSPFPVIFFLCPTPKNWKLNEKTLPPWWPDGTFKFLLPFSSPRFPLGEYGSKVQNWGLRFYKIFKNTFWFIVPPALSKAYFRHHRKATLV